MKTLALFVVDGTLLLAVGVAIAFYEPTSWLAPYLGAAGTAIAAAAVLASIAYQIRNDQRAADID